MNVDEARRIIAFPTTWSITHICMAIIVITQHHDETMRRLEQRVETMLANIESKPA